jgi:diguanylate cyclase (GGDEF)-like protein
MTTVLIACAAALAATALLAVVLIVLRRRERNESDERLAEMVDRFNERMEAMVREVSRALERAQEEARPPHEFGELSSSIDLDEVLTRTLEAAASYPGVDAALVAVEDGSAPAVAAAIGMSLDESPRPSPAAPPDGSRPRAISVVYEYDAEDNPGDAIRAGISVPLLSHGELIGYLAVYTRGAVHLFGEAQARMLEELALRAGPAIQNARLFREARQLADLDALTALHNRRYFHETLAREVARAQRYERSLALVVIDVDDFKAVNDRIGHLAGDGVLAEAAERVRDVVRSADVACRVGGDEFAVIMPESGIQDAEQLYQRLESAVSTRPVGQAGRLHLSAGISELRDDDDAISFFQRTDENLYRAKRAGKGAVQGDDDSEGGGDLPPGDDPTGPTPIRPVPDPPNQPPSASETAGSS